MKLVPRYFPTCEQFRSLAGAHAGKTVPVFRRILADHLTPVGVFDRMAAETDHAFLLESVVGGERIARYSFVGVNPCERIRIRDGRMIRETEADELRESTVAVTDPFRALEQWVAAHRTVSREKLGDAARWLPRFTGGAVGYSAYDAARYYERLPGAPTDDRGLDDLAFGLYGDMIAFDHVNNSVIIIATARLDGPASDASYEQAVRRIEYAVAKLTSATQRRPGILELDGVAAPNFSSNFSQRDFEAAVRRAKEYIIAGDIFQVVLSRRLRLGFAGSPFDVYRALRHVNPSPFMFYLKSPQSILIGASPEILCRVEEGRVTNRPLAGTRRRGATPGEDAALEKELRADPKDRAEHIMLVDLGRNDVGRVAAPGSVCVTEMMNVERYSHVMHLASNVIGQLAPGCSAVDALQAALPVGTVSGAPKVRAMEIIDELEPVRRGPYGGAVGYLDFAGNMDTCIALRTMVVTPDRDADGTAAADSWTIDIQAGAGIVADSDPTLEFEETMNKAKALLFAVGIATSHDWLDADNHSR